MHNIKITNLKVCMPWANSDLSEYFPIFVSSRALTLLQAEAGFFSQSLHTEASLKHILHVCSFSFSSFFPPFGLPSLGSYTPAQYIIARLQASISLLSVSVQCALACSLSFHITFTSPHHVLWYHILGATKNNDLSPITFHALDWLDVMMNYMRQ